MRELDEAVTLYEEAVALYESLDSPDLWRNYARLGAIHSEAGDLAAALAAYERSLQEIESIRQRLEEKGSQLPYIADKLQVYDQLIELLTQPEVGVPARPGVVVDTESAKRAFQVFERKQGRVFLDQIATTKAQRFARISPTRLQQEQRLLREYDHAFGRLVELEANRLPGDNRIDGSVVQAERELEIVDGRLKAFRAALASDHPHYHALKYPAAIDIARLQERLAADEALLVYSLPNPEISDQILLWLIDRAEFQLYRLTTEVARGDSLEWRIAQIRGALEKGFSTVDSRRGASGRHFPKSKEPLEQATHRLYEWLFPLEVRQRVAGKSLYIVPTGVLYDLPFEVLAVKPSANGDQRARYLIEEHPISYLSSASLLRVIRDGQEGRSDRARHPLLAFADPVYNTGDQSATSLESTDLLPLPETAVEATRVQKVLGAASESPAGVQAVQLREAATKQQLLAFNELGILADYRYLLFAMHGVLRKIDQRTQPTLAFSHPPEQSNPLSGEKSHLLTLAEVFGLELDADLVMLSACDTGAGDAEGAAEGIRGFTGAFLYAGTPAVTVTLWPVETHSATAMSVGLFSYLKRGLSPAKALQAIKLDLLRGDSERGELWQHPSYWAPFVLFGDGT